MLEMDESTTGAAFKITWRAAVADGSFEGYVRFATPECAREVATGDYAVMSLALCLGRILERGFACSPQCSGDLICLEADSLEMELLQTSLVVELVFTDTSGPDLRTSQLAFHNGVMAFLSEVRDWAFAQPIDTGTEELAELVHRIQHAALPGTV
jgi:hypothetical protein